MSAMNIKRGIPYSVVLTITINKAAYPLTGLTVFFTVKKVNDNADNDLGALITKNITVHTDALGGITTLILTAADTLIPIGEYKADFKIYSGAGINLNTTTFPVKVIDIVTKRIV
jgi:hypothetical protein